MSRSADAYRRHRARMGAISAADSRAGRDIAPLPPIAFPERRAAAAASFRSFCESYLPEKFTLAWSDDHLLAIRLAEQAILRSGLFALAMPRGSGKTTLAEAALLWAALYGHRRFIALIGPDEAHAAAMLANLKTECETNDRLLADFPETIHPIRCLDGIANRCKGQTCYGSRTLVAWNQREVILPTIAGSPAAGATIRARGITGRLRGMKRTLADGRTIRPDLAVIDDPQTDESAASASQCAKRLATLNGAILGLAGPGQRIAGILPCTVIYPGDLADQVLDREKAPHWHGLRTKLVYAWPERQDLWDQYAALRGAGLREGDDGKAATAFYAAHRDEMDQGARPAWPARHNEDELSAIQHAVNLRLNNEAAFAAEYQNEPLRGDSTPDELTADQIAARVNRLARGTIPAAATVLTAYIDLQKKLLYYIVAAWEPGFTGAVIDYGTLPNQKRAYFTLQDAQRTLAHLFPKTGLEGQLYAGLAAVTATLLDREWPRDNGTIARIDRLLIDANWGESTETVYRFCRESKHAANLYPAHGKYIGPNSAPMSAWTRKAGDRIGHHWRIPSTAGKRQIRHLLIDTNYWKTFVHTGLATPRGDPRAITLFGTSPDEHRMIADQLTAEYRTRKQTSTHREVDEWRPRIGRPDNHYLDCLAGAAAAAAMADPGLALALAGQAAGAAPHARRPAPGQAADPPAPGQAARRPRKRVTYIT